SPLYGRADEIMKITPLEAGWLTIALGCTSENAIAEYSIWGGVPRYWELRAENKSMKSAVINTILDRYGVLHEEPVRLFLDDMRESVQAFSILSVVGSGCNRISEIAGRLNKPATQLSRPIDSLIQLGYLKRELPFGESVKTSKRGIYKIADPFMNFYFSFLAPNLSRLELGLTNQVYSAFEARQSKYVSQEWENLCRRCVPMSPIKGIDFDIASRWWGSNLKKEQMEFDVVAESLDRKVLLIGECKWSKITDSNRIFYELEEKAKVFPFAEGKSIMLALFVKSHPKKNEDSRILGPSDVLERLR
ncbi:MAG: ATP-binding protein, partial [Bacteroidetes bacterium]|nr:ATP-binding protein [Bacteroidota bacterium]